MRERNLLYEKVLEILSTEGWIRGEEFMAKTSYTLISAFWYANARLKVKQEVLHSAFDHIREVIGNTYPERVSGIRVRISEFSGHKDTTLNDVVKVLQLAIGEMASPKEKERPKAIKFREWF